MLGALSFTAPLMLAALAALPVIWFLLRATPPEPQRVRFPAFIILRQLKTAEETPDRTPWWLLLLRIVLAALIIIGLAGPVLNAPPPSPGAGPLVLVVDDTWPAAQQWNARRDAVAEAAAEAAQGDRPLFILTTAPQIAPADPAPITGEDARLAARALAPQPFSADRTGLIAQLERLDPYLENAPQAEIRWLSDGVAGEDDAAFARTLAERGALSVMIDRDASKTILRRMGQDGGGVTFRIERLQAADSLDGALIATARDGRELARAPFEIPSGERSYETTLELPLALRNELASVRIDNAFSAASVSLVDARDRRALVGLVADADRGRNNLLSGGHYIRQALGPYAEFVEGSLDAILASDASVIVLNDVGRLRAGDADALRAWVARGGVLVRFAGPTLAEAAQDGTPPLLPAPLRGGGRAFGGALTWDTPQSLDGFSPESPFAGLEAAPDVLVRRQVLAQPGGETTTRTWARLQDGTPLVTGAREGAGVIALFHVTATPQWSDLPISGLFVDMLRRLTFLSSLGPDSVETAAARYAPLRLMDGFGAMRRPTDADVPLSTDDLALPPAPERRPGFYGPPEAPLALNAVSAETPFEPIALPGFRTAPYEAAPPTPLSPPLFAIALFLLLADGLLTLMISGRLPRFGAAGPAAAASLIIAFQAAAPSGAAAQEASRPLDPEIDEQTIDAALATRLAYVRTGDPAIDRLSAQGLAALSRELTRRTAVEPAPPDGVDLDTDDLYPLSVPLLARGAGRGAAVGSGARQYREFHALRRPDSLRHPRRRTRRRRNDTGGAGVSGDPVATRHSAARAGGRGTRPVPVVLPDERLAGPDRRRAGLGAGRRKRRQ